MSPVPLTKLAMVVSWGLAWMAPQKLEAFAGAWAAARPGAIRGCKGQEGFGARRRRLGARRRRLGWKGGGFVVSFWLRSLWRCVVATASNGCCRSAAVEISGAGRVVWAWRTVALNLKCIECLSLVGQSVWSVKQPSFARLLHPAAAVTPCSALMPTEAGTHIYHTWQAYCNNQAGRHHRMESHGLHFQLRSSVRAKQWPCGWRLRGGVASYGLK